MDIVLRCFGGVITLICRPIAGTIVGNILDGFSSTFAFRGVLPNARAKDLLGEGFGARSYQASVHRGHFYESTRVQKTCWGKACIRSYQASVDRGHFYVWANKRGTVVDTSGALCRAGNCEPAWARLEGATLQGVGSTTYKYKVSGDWPRKLWQEFKLEDAV